MPLPPDQTTRMFYGTYEFGPVPLLTWNTELVRDSKDESLYFRHTLDFAGVLLETPAESGDFLGLMEQRRLMHEALAVSGQELRILHKNVSVVSGVFPTLETLTFEEGTWTTLIPYGFSFSYNEQVEDKPPIESYGESWSFQEAEDRVSVSVEHQVSAVGVNTAPSGANNALDNARDYVLAKTGYDKVPGVYPAFAEGSGTLQAYEELRSENVDIQGASYEINERFVLASGFFTHTQTIAYSTDDQGISTITVDGQINGLGRKHTAFQHALSAWNDYVEPRLRGQASAAYTQFYGSGTLYTSSMQSQSITKTEHLGSIQYNRVYSDNPAGDLPEDIQDASVSAQNNEPVKLYASFAIPNRSTGNIVQDVGTTTEGTYTISGTVTGKQSTSIERVKSYAQERANGLLPGFSYIDIRLSAKSVTVDELRNTVNFSVTWTYTVDNSGAAQGLSVQIL